MKFKVFIFLFILQLTYGQKTENNNLVKFNHDIRVNAIIPSNFGANFLAEANDGKLGIGTNFSFLRIHNFKLGAGYDYIPYSTTDITKAGNIDGAHYHTAYGNISYEIKILEKLNIEPYFGIGDVRLKFSSSDKSFGKQTGNNIRIGFNTDYQLAKRLSVFLGLCYLHSNLDINTSPEFVSFYDNAKLIQLNIGLKIH
ncbi:hypothetical protein [Flavobacterium hungaricum]|uniref:Outer membrane protein beta-barrel domain-containing protein n=1 Tax=Flavobacterium hungaricum TaxID=2082725 RepID=A0ABR9TFX1_9FLAO|nr:hypothetical protein [Flavobacterium hungaricum]MBE8724150.1 hypothetical protein [Flavobacterium hungaricum]